MKQEPKTIRITIRYNRKEIAIIEKNRKGQNRSEFIRIKSISNV